MSGPSIFETAWINLVFEGKNKEYGAYQLRRENPKTTIKAFFLGLCLVTALAMLPYLLSSFGTAPGKIPVPAPTLEAAIPVTLPPKDPEPPKPNTATPPVAIEQPNQPTVNSNPIIVDIPLATPNLDPGVNTTPTAEPGTSGTGTPLTGTPGGGESPISTTPAVTSGPEAAHIVVDKMPEYPGGMKKFRKYIEDNFKAPDAEDSGDATVKVLVSFVVEKDGSISDIKILRNPGYGMDKEAIRVLKALKIKWIPGQIAGQAVRTVYNLPIAVQPQQ
jgi:periplasmic protein TonB